MTITQKDILLSILSMDSYNRGYDPRIDLISLGNSGAVGGATLFTSSTDQLGLELTSSVGFYAAAYNTDYGTVISYRGTDFDGGPATNDVLHGWAFAPGDFTADQLELSTEFLESIVLGQVSFDVILTGHSLGGGLATLH